MRIAIIKPSVGQFNAESLTFSVEAYAYDLDAEPKPYAVDKNGNPVLVETPLGMGPQPLDPLPPSPIPKVGGTYPHTAVPTAVIADLLKQAQAGFAALVEAELATLDKIFTGIFITADVLMQAQPADKRS